MITYYNQDGTEAVLTPAERRQADRKVRADEAAAARSARSAQLPRWDDRLVAAVFETPTTTTTASHATTADLAEAQAEGTAAPTSAAGVGFRRQDGYEERLQAAEGKRLAELAAAADSHTHLEVGQQFTIPAGPFRGWQAIYLGDNTAEVDGPFGGVFKTTANGG